MSKFATSHTKSPRLSVRRLFFLGSVISLGLLLIFLAYRFAKLQPEDALLRDSTLGDLAIWMAEQSEEEEIESLLGQYAENWAQSLGQASLAPEIAIEAMRGILIFW